MKRLSRHDAHWASILITSRHRSTCPPFPEVGNARTGSNGSAIHSDPADRHGRTPAASRSAEETCLTSKHHHPLGRGPTVWRRTQQDPMHTYSAILPSIHRATGGLGRQCNRKELDLFLGRMSKASLYRSSSSNRPARQGGRTVEISGLATQQR